jgi:hypothetical protein
MLGTTEWLHNLWPLVWYSTVIIIIIIIVFFGPWSLFQLLNPIHNQYVSLVGDQAVAKPLPTHRTTQTQNKHKEKSMPRMGFEPTNPVLGRRKQSIP